MLKSADSKGAPWVVALARLAGRWNLADGDSGSCNFNPESNCSKSTFFVGVQEASGLDFLAFSSLAARNKSSILTIDGGLEAGDESLPEPSESIKLDNLAS